MSTHQADKVPGTAPSAASEKGAGDKQGSPEWSVGLKRMYDAVLDEALPPDMQALLDRLDETGDG